MTTLRSSNLSTVLAVTLLASACSNAGDAPLAEPTGRMRAAPVSVVQAPDGTRHVSVVVAPAERSEPLELMQVALDGKLVPEENIRSHRASTALVVLVDDSVEMGERGLSPAANGLLQAVAHAVAPHSDRIGAMAFNDTVSERYHYASPQSLVKRRGLRLDPSGQRCLNLGLETAIGAASTAPLPSRSVLVATSGEDSGGSCAGPDRDTLISQAQAEGIAVNVAQLGPSDEALESLRELASQTGGQFWVLGTTDSLDALAGEVASALASHLYVSFEIPGARGEMPLEVRAGTEDSVLAATLDLHAENGVITTHNDELAVPVAAAAVAGAGGAGSVGSGPAAPPGSGSGGAPGGAPPVVDAPATDGGGAAPAAVASAAAASSSAMTQSMAIAGAAVAVGLLLMRRRRSRKERETHVALAAVRANAEAERRAADAARSAEAARAIEIARAEDMERAAASARAEEAERTAEVARAQEEERLLEQARAAEEAEAAQIARARQEAREEQIRRDEDERAAEVARAHDEARTREAAEAEAAARAAALAVVAEERRARLAAEEAAAAERAAAAGAFAASDRPAPASPPAVNGTANYLRADLPARAGTQSDAAPFALVGTVCGRYRLEAPLGRGGLGEVYRARDLQFDRTVAVKVLSDDVFGGADAFDSLMREVSLVDRITHPNVVRVYDVIRFEGRVAIVMEYVHGQSLSAITREQGVIAPEDFDAVLSGVAEALDAAHAAGVVHGDVTPGNVLITEDGKVKLCDFGVGRLVGDDPSAPRAGTPRFVAPEVINGADAGPHSDVFSLGALTLHVIAGRDADLSAVSAPFRRALEGALEPDPFMRCASAGALAVAFHNAVDEDLLRRRGPVRRFVDTLRLRTRREQETGPVDLPPTVTFPALASSRTMAHDYIDPDQTRPLPPPGELTAPFAPDVTRPLGPQ